MGEQTRLLTKQAATTAKKPAATSITAAGLTPPSAPCPDCKDPTPTTPTTTPTTHPQAHPHATDSSSPLFPILQIVSSFSSRHGLSPTARHVGRCPAPPRLDRLQGPRRGSTCCHLSGPKGPKKPKQVPQVPRCSRKPTTCTKSAYAGETGGGRHALALALYRTVGRGCPRSQGSRA